MCYQMFDALNRRWGEFISSYPGSHIFASLAVVVLFSVHLTQLQLENDIRRSFSPPHSKSMYESRVYREFYGLSVPPQRAFMLFTAKDKGSMLRPEQLREVLTLHDNFLKVLKVEDAMGINSCDPLCDLNAPFQLISRELTKIYENKSGQEGRRKNFVLDYPTATYEGAQLFIGMNMIGVQTTDHIFAINSSRITHVQTLVLWYFSRSDTPERQKRLHDTILDLFDAAKRDDFLQHVKFNIFGDEIANSEMIRGAIEAIFLMTIGFLLLLAFITLVVWRRMTHTKAFGILVVVLASILSPLLASVAAFGILTWIGYPTYSIMCVTPFLIAGVGVDDAFIFLQSWEQQRAISRRQRLAVVMVHVGPSITITSLTNTVAFGIGWLTPTPQMSNFCLCTSIAIFLDYLLTFTLLAPSVLLITAKDGDKVPAVTLSSEKNGETELALPNDSASVSPESSAVGERTTTSWLSKYSTFLHTTQGRAFGLLSLAALYAVSTSGILRMRSTFEPSKAFPSDSPLTHSMESVRQVFDEFFPISMIVNSPPDISNATELAMFNTMVGELEALPESYGNRTLLWLKHYIEFDREVAKLWELVGFQSSHNYTPSYDNLEFFLDNIGHPPTIKMEKGINGTRRLRSFQFTIIARNMAEWSNRAILEEKCRDILLNYMPTFNATIHDGDSAVLNMLLTVKVDLIGSITATILCMTVICSFFIPNQIGIVIIALTITSICYCLVGLMSWWGADLDPVTLVDVLLATGFSVDYTAHVAHQFYMKRGSSLARMAASLEEMGPPMLQAGTSTVLCMLPLGFVPTYAIVAFAKTIFLVVGLGLLHGLFFLPLLLCATPSQRNESKCLTFSLVKYGKRTLRLEQPANEEVLRGLQSETRSLKL